MTETKQDKKSFAPTNSVESFLSSDRFTAFMLSDPVTAQNFLQFVLPSEVSASIDLTTLDVVKTQLYAADGKEDVGDFFFTVEYKEGVASKDERATFVIVLEHKSQDDPEVAIQVGRYAWGLLDRMRLDKKRFAAPNGRYPWPYIVVFSQDHSKREPKRLRDLVTTLPCVRHTIPEFHYQYFKISQTPLEKIAKCEKLTALFLTLERLAYQLKGDKEKEIEVVAARLQECLREIDPDLRMQDGVSACLYYLDYIRSKRPNAPTTEEIIEKMQIDGLVLSDAPIVKEWFPKYYARVESEKELAREEIKREREKRLAAEENAKIERENAKKERENAKKERENAKIERENAKIERENAATALRDLIMHECGRRFSSQRCEEFAALVQGLDDNSALCEVLRDFRDDASFTEVVAKVKERLASRS